MRTFLAAALAAGPCAAQVRVAPAGEAVSARAAVVPAAVTAPGALTLSAMPAPLTSASLPMSAPTAAPATALSAAALPAPSAAPAVVARYRELSAARAAVEREFRSDALVHERMSMVFGPSSELMERRAALDGELARLRAENPTIEHDSKGALARAWARLTGSAPALEARAAAASGRAFDGETERAAAPADEEEAPEEDLPSDVADAAPQITDLFLTRESKAGVGKGQLTAQVGLIKGAGSQWYWDKFRKGAKIALKSGGRTLFVSRVTAAKTIKIASMQRQDFAGLFAAQRMAGKSLSQLRHALVQDLKDRQARRPGAPTPVSTQSQVRIVRFLSAVEARELPENKDESSYPTVPRSRFELPAALQGLNHLLPKTVLLDMRLFPDGVPYPLLEDMTKLMKAGVYFVLLSDKPGSAVEEQLTRRLSVKQRDLVSRYKMVILSDDGNSLSGYSGNFPKALPSQRFTPQQLEIMAFVAASNLPGASVDAGGTRLDVVLPKGMDADKARAIMVDGLSTMRLTPERWSWRASTRGGRTVLTARPQSLTSALPHLLEVMREHEGVYANHSDLMVISRDAALLGALPGSVQPAAHLNSDGELFADQALASLLGPYRENRPGDLAASASKIQGFLQNPNGGYGGFGNVYMMTGHIMHSAFNWAVWRYRNTGVLPSAEETVAVARGIWEHEAAAAGAKNLLGRPGESLAGFYETVEQRLRAMHEVAADILKTYPIAVGTELPNMVILDRYKKGVPDGRDVFRLIFDFVVARQAADGRLEVVIVDFKTGQVPTLQSLEKDTQVQLYDLLVRRMWKTLPLPYGGAGTAGQVSDYKIKFLYTAGAYQPQLNDWTRLKFEKFLKNVMNRIRRHNNPPAPKGAKPEGKKK